MTTHDGTGSRVASMRTVGSIAESLGAMVVGDAEATITGLATIDEAREGHLTFARSNRFARKLAACRATAAVVGRRVNHAAIDTGRLSLLVVDDADAAMIRLLRLFAPTPVTPAPGFAESAEIDPTATIGHGVYIGPNCVVGPDVVIGDGAVLVANVILAPGVQVGAITVLHPGVVVQDRCVIGSACIIHPNCTIGADGFGYHPAPDGRGLVKIPHIGIVRIGDAVEIGANSCVDRAKFGETVIGDGTKIDNLVQIGHNCHIGRSVIICGCTGIGGSVTVGDGVVIAGGVGVADGVNIGRRATLAARAAVMHDVPDGETWFGYPALLASDAMRQTAFLRRMSRDSRRRRKFSPPDASKGT